MSQILTNVYSHFSLLNILPLVLSKKTLTVDDINQFIQEDNVKCLTVEAMNECSFGFNLSNDVEKAAAIQVVRDKHNFTVGGWNIGNIIPNWVKVLKSGIFTTVCLTK
jgi:hypothetical protein